MARGRGKKSYDRCDDGHRKRSGPAPARRHLVERKDKKKPPKSA